MCVIGPFASFVMTTRSGGETELLLRRTFRAMWSKYHQKYIYYISLNAQQYSADDQQEAINMILNKLKNDQPSKTLSSLLTEPINFSELEYQKEIGRGSHGLVYVARYRNKIVAVKQMLTPAHSSNLDKNTIVSFLSEMHLMSTLRHPNIIRFIGAVLKSPRLCMVVEYAKEGTVCDYLLNNKSRDWQSYKRNIAIGIARGGS